MTDNTNNYEHQDWKTVVLKKSTKPSEVRKENARKTSNNISEKDRRLMENDLDHTRITKFERTYINKVIQKRGEKKWKQKQLANQLNVPEHTIQQLEQGKLTYNGQLKNKIDRLLGIS